MRFQHTYKSIDGNFIKILRLKKLFHVKSESKKGKRSEIGRLPHEVIILTKFHEDWTKNVIFFTNAQFFYVNPSSPRLDKPVISLI